MQRQARRAHSPARIRPKPPSITAVELANSLKVVSAMAVVSNWISRVIPFGSGTLCLFAHQAMAVTLILAFAAWRTPESASEKEIDDALGRIQNEKQLSSHRKYDEKIIGASEARLVRLLHSRCDHSGRGRFRGWPQAPE
jgi:hypothetical protein